MKPRLTDIRPIDIAVVLYMVAAGGAAAWMGLSGRWTGAVATFAAVACGALALLFAFGARLKAPMLPEALRRETNDAFPPRDDPWSPSKGPDRADSMA